MTRTELVKKLRDTAKVMAAAAGSLRFYGAVSANAIQHAEELAGAAEMVGEWADEIEKDGNVSATFPADISRDSEKTLDFL